jgi:hypothetical protein
MSWIRTAVELWLHAVLLDQGADKRLSKRRRRDDGSKKAVSKVPGEGKRGSRRFLSSLSTTGCC